MNIPLMPDSYFPPMPGFVAGTNQEYTCKVYFYIDRTASLSTMVWRIRKFESNLKDEDYTEQDVEMKIVGILGAVFTLNFVVSPDCIYQFFRAGWDVRDTCVADPILISTVGFYE